MITGAQIRQARQLLGWGCSRLAERARLQISTIQRAECVDGEAPITLAHEAAIRLAFESAGVEFTDGDAPDVTLKGKARARRSRDARRL